MAAVIVLKDKTKQPEPSTTTQVPTEEDSGDQKISNRRRDYKPWNALRLHRALASRLARYKHPREVKVLKGPIPRNAMGKGTFFFLACCLVSYLFRDNLLTGPGCSEQEGTSQGDFWSGGLSTGCFVQSSPVVLHTGRPGCTEFVLSSHRYSLHLHLTFSDRW